MNEILTEYFDLSQESVCWGILCEGANAGQPIYVEIDMVKRVYIDDEWVDNSGYNLTTARDAEITIINNDIIDLSVKKDKADALGLTEEAAVLQTEIDTKNTRKTYLNSL
jgi:hypothetical protein